MRHAGIFICAEPVPHLGWPGAAQVAHIWREQRIGDKVVHRESRYLASLDARRRRWPRPGARSLEHRELSASCPRRVNGRGPLSSPRRRQGSWRRSAALLWMRARTSTKTAPKPLARPRVGFFDRPWAYRAFANQANARRVAMTLSEGERRWGVQHVQIVCNCNVRITLWRHCFNGVTTIRVSYLGWHRAHDCAGNTFTESQALAAAWSSLSTSTPNSA